MKKYILLFAIVFMGYNGFAKEATLAPGTIIHQVFFWLEQPDSMEDKAELKKGLTTQCDKKNVFLNFKSGVQSPL